MTNPKLIRCFYCKEQIKSDVEECPFCHKKQSPYLNIAIIIGTVILLCLIAYFIYCDF